MTLLSNMALQAEVWT